jgi:hypothetical protein
MRVEMWAFESATWTVTFPDYGTAELISQTFSLYHMNIKNEFSFDGRKCNFKGIRLEVAGKGKKKGKDNPVTVHGGPQGCERLRLPHYLDKRQIDGEGCQPYAPAALYYQVSFIYFF